MADRECVDGPALGRTTVTTSSKNRPSGGKSWLLALAFVAVTFIAYQPVWHAGYIWDDDDHLTANPAMTAPHGLRMIWSSLAISRYYPLTLTTFWVQHRLWGLNPLPYHLVNVAFHAISGLLVFLVLRRLRVPAAWLAAGVWLLHPVNVESVAWVTELKNTQSGAFFFCALLCFLRFEEQERWGWYVLAVLCGACAVLSKPSTVVLPLVLLLCVWWQRGRWRRTDFVRTGPFFALALGMSVLTIIEQRGHIARQGEAEWSLGIAERFVVAGKDIWFYAGKVLWPVNLTFVYPRWEVMARTASSWLPLAAVAAGGLVLLRWRRQPWARASLFGLSFFVVALLPVLGFFDVFYFRYSFVADHFQYLASLGIIAWVASGTAYVLNRNGLWPSPVRGAICLVLLLGLGCLTWRQGHIYRNSESLWRDTVKKNPGCWMAHDLLGSVVMQAGAVDEAMGHFEQALRIKPDYPEALNNLGVALERSGRLPEAIAHYQQALRLKPYYADPYYNLGIALERQGRSQEAMACYEQALRIKPDYAEAHNNLGNILVASGRVPEAIEHWEQALRVRPDFAGAHNNLGSALLGLGRVSEAIRQYEEALRLAPDYARAHYNLGTALDRAGRVSEAIAHYEQAVRLQPDFVDAHYSLGNDLLQLGKLEDAIRHLDQAVQLKPDYAEAHNNLGAALGRMGKPEEAMRHFERALQIKPDYAEACNNLGAALARAGRNQEAIAYYERALRLKPNYAEAQNNLGSVLLTLGRVPEAIQHYEQALWLDPDYARTQYNLGTALERAGRVQEAIGHYEQAVRLKPDFAEARDRLTRLRNVP